MKSTILALGWCLVVSTAVAQTNAAAAAGNADVTQTSPVKPMAKDVWAQCRADANANGLKGVDRRTAVQDCAIKARPDLAVVIACRKEGRDKGLTDKDLHAFVKDCKRNKS